MTRKMLAGLGSALFLIIAPGIVAGFIPWWISKWNIQAPFLGFAPLPALGALLLVVSVICAFCIARGRHPFASVSNALSRGEGTLSLCSQPDVPSGRVNNFRSGHDPREREPLGVRPTGLVGLSPVCFGVRGADFTENLRDRVRRLLCQCASMGTSSESVERGHQALDSNH